MDGKLEDRKAGSSRAVVEIRVEDHRFERLLDPRLRLGCNVHAGVSAREQRVRRSLSVSEHLCLVWSSRHVLAYECEQCASMRQRRVGYDSGNLRAP